MSGRRLNGADKSVFQGIRVAYKGQNLKVNILFCLAPAFLAFEFQLLGQLIQSNLDGAGLFRLRFQFFFISIIGCPDYPVPSFGF